MARTLVTPQTTTIAAGVVPTYNAAAGAGANNGNYFNWSPNVEVHIKNANAGTVTVTVKASGNKQSGIVMPDLTYSMPTNTELVIPPLDPQFFADSTGRVNIDFSANTGVTFSLIQNNGGYV